MERLETKKSAGGERRAAVAWLGPERAFCKATSANSRRVCTQPRGSAALPRRANLEREQEGARQPPRGARERRRREPAGDESAKRCAEETPPLRDDGAAAAGDVSPADADAELDFAEAADATRPPPRARTAPARRRGRSPAAGTTTATRLSRRWRAPTRRRRRRCSAAAATTVADPGAAPPPPPPPPSWRSAPPRKRGGAVVAEGGRVAESRLVPDGIRRSRDGLDVSEPPRPGAAAARRRGGFEPAPAAEESRPWTRFSLWRTTRATRR